MEANIASAQTKTSATDAVWPSVTVVVPSYRHARFVQGCLDSVIATKYPDLEIVIINDASPEDDDRAIRTWLAKHPDVRTHYICHSQNQGLPKSLNEAIDIATGEYFCLIAADDLLLANGIHDRVAYLQQNPHKLAVFADCHIINNEGERVFESGLEGLSRKRIDKRDLAIDALIPYVLIFNWAIPGPIFMCHKQLFSIIGNYNENLLVEDKDMYLRAAARNLLGFLDTFVAEYRVHDGGFWRRYQSDSSRRLVMQRAVDETHRALRPLFGGTLGRRLELYMLLYERQHKPLTGFAGALRMIRVRWLGALTKFGYIYIRFVERLKHT